MELLFKIGGFIVEVIAMLPTISLLIKLQVYTLIHTPVIVTIKLPITKTIRILNFNSIGISNAGIQGLKRLI